MQIQHGGVINSTTFEKWTAIDWKFLNQLNSLIQIGSLNTFSWMMRHLQCARIPSSATCRWELIWNLSIQTSVRFFREKEDELKWNHSWTEPRSNVFSEHESTRFILSHQFFNLTLDFISIRQEVPFSRTRLNALLQFKSCLGFYCYMCLLTKNYHRMINYDNWYLI